MSKVIKKIKVMKENGTFTEPIPIGANAENVKTEDGITVEEKIGKKTYYFNNVAEMKAYKLKNGDYVTTLGYYATNDGGGANYLIRTKTNADVQDNGSIHFVGSNLVAELIVDNEVRVEFFGAKGDGVTDDTTSITNAIKYSSKIDLLQNKIYKISKLTINKNLIINGNNATFKDIDSNEHFIEMTSATSNLILRINNLTIDCEHCDIGIYINKNKILANYLTIKNSQEINMQIIKTDSYGVCELNYINCENSNVGIQLNATDCKINNYMGHNNIKHLVVRGGITHLNNIHGWNFNSQSKDWITGSCLIDTDSSIIGNDLYIDTLENGIILPNDKPYNSIVLQNVAYFLNLSSYPSTQQAPTLLKNVENYTGFVRIDGLNVNENNWKDQNNNYPVLIDNIDLSKISLTNVTNSGFKFERYRPFETNTDINTTSYTVNEDTYFNASTRKLKLKDYDIHAYISGNMKTSCPNNTIIFACTFTGQQLNNLSRRSRVSAKFVESSNEGVIYDLPASIDNNHKLFVYNNSGITLGSTGHYGNLIIYIDDFNQK